MCYNHILARFWHIYTLQFLGKYKYSNHTFCKTFDVVMYFGPKPLIITLLFCNRLKATSFKCHQLCDKDIRSPLSPPNILPNAYRDSMVEEYKNSDDARTAYKSLLQLKKFNKTKRKYLPSSCYDGYFNCCTSLLDIRQIGNVDLDIELANGGKTILKIRNLETEREILDTVIIHNAIMSRANNVRESSGDLGYMWAFGQRTKDNNYAINSKTKPMEHIQKKYCTDMRAVLLKYFPTELQEIIQSNKDQGIAIANELGGEDGISGYYLVSENLKNASHYDVYDQSVSISLFIESIPSEAKDWVFILPNTHFEGSNKGIAIQLFNGCTISWYGNIIRHCTGYRGGISPNNRLYGNFFGAKTWTSH